MILYIDRGCYVRNTGFGNPEISYNDVKYNFPILEGIDYNGNSVNAKLVYMEV